jgi:23S rRNA (adenine2503-C2)-methyltransferase
MDNSLFVFDYTFGELVDAFRVRYGKGRFHAAALFRELYGRMNADVTRSPDIAASHVFADRLRQDLVVDTGDVVDTLEKDGVTKFATRLADGALIESVVLPMETHHTVCVSSQVGCRMNCRFCETGKLGLRRQLAVHEIVGQVYAARKRFGPTLRNVVFMGMGEPFDNFDNVMRAVRVINDQRGLDIALRHITVSTVGLVDGIRTLAALDMPLLKLAVSLNAPNDRIRSDLMPVNRAHSMPELKQALMAYPMKKGNTIMVAYVLIPGVNDDPAHAEELAAYLAPLPAKVNLIPFNPGPDTPYRSPDETEVASFRDRLIARGVNIQRRSTKGRDLMAACGQLGSRVRDMAF